MEKLTGRKIWRLALAAVLAAAFGLGCGSSHVQNARIYDKYAELMKQRKAAGIVPASESAAQAGTPAPAVEKPKSPAPEAQKADVKKPQEKKAEPKKAEAKTAPAKKDSAAPKKVAAPKAEKSAPKTKEEPAPVIEEIVEEAVPQEEAAPVEIVLPALTEEVVEVAPTEESASVEEPAPVEEPEPAQEEAPAPKEESVEVAPAVRETSGTEPAAADNSAYALKVGDGVQIALRGIPQSEQIECLVDEWGTISLPLINEVEATGLSASELAKRIRQIYIDRGIYKNISVNVMIPTRYYFMQGEIRQPGRYQLISAVRLSQAIASAAGFTDFANGKVDIKRNGVIYKTIKNAKKLDRNPEDDILLEPGDIIEAARSIW